MGNRSNTVFGPARRPIFDPDPHRGNARRYVQADTREVVWSYPGDVTPAGLAAAGRSPAWVSIAGGTLHTIRFATVWGHLGAASSSTVIVSVYVNEGELTTLNASGGAKKRFDIESEQDDVRWAVSAASSAPADTVLGHGLSVFMWYRLL